MKHFSKWLTFSIFVVLLLAAGMVYAQVPYSENFSSGIPSDWNIENTDMAGDPADDGAWHGSDDPAYNCADRDPDGDFDGQYAIVDSECEDNDGVEDYDVMETEWIDFNGTYVPMVSFMHWFQQIPAGYEGTFEVGYDDGAARAEVWTPLATYAGDTAIEAQMFNVATEFAASVDGMLKFRWVYDGDGGTWGGFWIVDDFMVYDACAPQGFPLVEDFESNWLPSECWSVFDESGTGNNDTWTPMADGGDMSAAVRYPTSGAAGEDWLVMPPLSIPTDGSNQLLTFYERQEFENTPATYDIYYTTGVVGDLASYMLLDGAASTDLTTTYTMRSVDLSGLAGQNVVLAFRFTSAVNQNSWYVDDINIDYNRNPVVTDVTMLEDGQGDANDYPVYATVTDADGDLDTIMLYYSLDGTNYNSIAMTNVTGDEYMADIPAQNACTQQYWYYVEAVDTAPNTVTSDTYTFTRTNNAPVFDSYTELADTEDGIGPYPVSATVSNEHPYFDPDHEPLTSAMLYYEIVTDGSTPTVPYGSSVAMDMTGDGPFDLSAEIPEGDYPIGTMIHYYIEVQDDCNTTTIEPISFEILCPTPAATNLVTVGWQDPAAPAPWVHVPMHEDTVYVDWDVDPIYYHDPVAETAFDVGENAANNALAVQFVIQRQSKLIELSAALVTQSAPAHLYLVHPNVSGLPDMGNIIAGPIDIAPNTQNVNMNEPNRGTYPWVGGTLWDADLDDYPVFDAGDIVWGIFTWNPDVQDVPRLFADERGNEDEQYDPNFDVDESHSFRRQNDNSWVEDEDYNFMLKLDTAPVCLSHFNVWRMNCDGSEMFMLNADRTPNDPPDDGYEVYATSFYDEDGHNFDTFLDCDGCYPDGDYTYWVEAIYDGVPVPNVVSEPVLGLPQDILFGVPEAVTDAIDLTLVVNDGRDQYLNTDAIAVENVGDDQLYFYNSTLEVDPETHEVCVQAPGGPWVCSDGTIELLLKELRQLAQDAPQKYGDMYEAALEEYATEKNIAPGTMEYYALRINLEEPYGPDDDFTATIGMNTSYTCEVPEVDVNVDIVVPDVADITGYEICDVPMADAAAPLPSWDFEANNGGYAAATNDVIGWEHGMPDYLYGPGAAHSGTNVWGVNLTGDYVNSLRTTLDSPEIMIDAAFDDVTLDYWVWQDTEFGFDGFNVKVSTNGTDWAIMDPVSPAYNDTYVSGLAERGYVGNSGGWVQHSFDLTGYIGQSIWLRWDFGADSSVDWYAGVYIDDVVIEGVDLDAGYPMYTVELPIMNPSSPFTQQMAYSATLEGAPAYVEIDNPTGSIPYDQTENLVVNFYDTSDNHDFTNFINDTWDTYTIRIEYNGNTMYPEIVNVTSRVRPYAEVWAQHPDETDALPIADRGTIENFPASGQDFCYNIWASTCSPVTQLQLELWDEDNLLDIDNVTSLIDGAVVTYDQEGDYLLIEMGSTVDGEVLNLDGTMPIAQVCGTVNAGFVNDTCDHWLQFTNVFGGNHVADNSQPEAMEASFVTRDAEICIRPAFIDIELVEQMLPYDDAAGWWYGSLNNAYSFTVTVTEVDLSYIEFTANTALGDNRVICSEAELDWDSGTTSATFNDVNNRLAFGANDGTARWSGDEDGVVFEGMLYCDVAWDYPSYSGGTNFTEFDWGYYTSTITLPTMAQVNEPICYTAAGVQENATAMGGTFTLGDTKGDYNNSVPGTHDEMNVTDIVNGIYHLNSSTNTDYQNEALDFNDDNSQDVMDIQDMILTAVRCYEFPAYFETTPDIDEDCFTPTATAVSTANLTAEVVDGELLINLDSFGSIAALQVDLTAADVTLSDAVASERLENMDVYTVTRDNETSIYVVNMSGESFAAGTGTILSIPVETAVSGDVTVENVIAIDRGRNEVATTFDSSPVEVLNLPKDFAASQNFPNPFNPSTTIKYQLPRAEHVSLKVYNAAGQLVRTLVEGQVDAGYHDVVWDSRNENGETVSSGVYFYRFNAGEYNNTVKMMLLK